MKIEIHLTEQDFCRVVDTLLPISKRGHDVYLCIDGHEPIHVEPKIVYGDRFRTQRKRKLREQVETEQTRRRSAHNKQRERLEERSDEEFIHVRFPCPVQCGHPGYDRESWLNNHIEREHPNWRQAQAAGGQVE